MLFLVFLLYLIKIKYNNWTVKRLKDELKTRGGTLRGCKADLVSRALEVWAKTGKRHSEFLEEKRLTEGQLRRPGATIILWLKADTEVLYDRLEARVDTMMEEGLIQELLDFHELHNKKRIKDGEPPDYTKGVFQTLGFKEFHDFLIMSEEERNSEKGQELLLECVDKMKRSTRNYAKKQNKMILSRLLEHRTREVPIIYDFDTTDISKWEENVTKKAVHIIESFLKNTPCQYEPLKPTPKEKHHIDTINCTNYCQECERIIMGDRNYEIHLLSNKHKKVLKRIEKQRELDEMLRNQ